MKNRSGTIQTHYLAAVLILSPVELFLLDNLCNASYMYKLITHPYVYYQ
jgi:hypothetical protein